MNVLICGARDWKDKKKIEKLVKTLDPKKDLVIEGGASGADKIAGELAKKYGIPLMVFPANWDFYHKVAGPIRNGWMIKFGKPDRVLAFHEKIVESRGTLNMVNLAKKAGIPVQVIS